MTVIQPKAITINVLVRVLLTEGDFDAAIGLLERLQRNAEAKAYTDDGVHALALLAVALHTVHPGSDEAVHALNHALTLAHRKATCVSSWTKARRWRNCFGLPPVAARHSLCSTTELP